VSGVVRARAILFDLDGVLVDSRRSIERVWQVWAAGRGIDPARFIAHAPGRRTSETLRLLAPDLDVMAETAALDAMEETEFEGLIATRGADVLLSSLPAGRWAIVTSGSRPVAVGRLRCAGLPIPRTFITGEEVRQGKPHPEPYLLGAERLGLAPADCVVVEDSPAGVDSAVAAGMTVIAVATTHALGDLGAAQVRVSGLDRLTVSVSDRELLVRY
jgi:sugar-phosphatase